MRISDNPEVQRIIELQRRYENKEILEEDIPKEDVEKMILIYKMQTFKRKKDIEKIEAKIARMKA